MLRALLPAVAIAISAAMGLAFRLWFWDTEQTIVAMVMLGIPLLCIVFATAVGVQKNEIPRAPRRGSLIGAGAGVAWVVGVLVPYAFGLESCDDSSSDDISCEGAAVLALMVLGAGGAAAGAVSGVAVWLFHDLFLVRCLSRPQDER